MSGPAVRYDPVVPAVPRPTPADSRDAIGRAVALHLGGKPDQAIQLLQCAVAAGAATPDIYRALGHLHLELGSADRAAENYRKLTELKPEYAGGWLGLGRSLQRNGGWKEACEAFQGFLRLSPTDADGWVGLGMCRLRLQDAASALRSFDSALELAAGREEALFGKAAALQMLGREREPAVFMKRSWSAIRNRKRRFPTSCRLK